MIRWLSVGLSERLVSLAVVIGPRRAAPLAGLLAPPQVPLVGRHRAARRGRRGARVHETRAARTAAMSATASERVGYSLSTAVSAHHAQWPQPWSLRLS